MLFISFKYKKTIIFLLIIAIIIVSLFALRWVATKLYPINYKEHISKYSAVYDVDPLLIAAIIRAESKYYKDAESHKGARGLMQITPATGEWIAQKIGIKNYNSDMLYDPEINIMMGCWYINNLKKQFNNNIELVLAAYNGGSGNVGKWLKDAKYSKDGVSLMNIPFKETKDYIERVQNNYKIYSKLYKKDDFN